MGKVTHDKLRLNRETVRELGKDGLAEVGGGAVTVILTTCPLIFPPLEAVASAIHRCTQIFCLTAD